LIKFGRPSGALRQVLAQRRCARCCISEWHKEGSRPPGYHKRKESHYRRADVIRWRSKGYCWVLA